MPTHKDVVVAVFGATGCGKTSFINLVANSNFPVAGGLEICTKKMQVTEPFRIDGYSICMVDVPAFNSEDQSDCRLLRRVDNFLAKSYGCRTKVMSIYMHRISSPSIPSISASSQTDYDIFRKFSDGSPRDIAIITSMWDEVDEQDGEMREARLKDCLFRPAIDIGAQVFRHDWVNSTRETAQDVLRYLLNREEIQHRTLSARTKNELEAESRIEKEKLLIEQENLQRRIHVMEADHMMQTRMQVEEHKAQMTRLKWETQQTHTARIKAMASEHASEIERFKREVEMRRRELEETHMKRLHTLIMDHQAEMEKFRYEIEQENAARLRQLASDHQAEIERLKFDAKQNHHMEVQAILVEHEEEKRNLRQEVEQEKINQIRNLMAQHQTELQKLQEQVIDGSKTQAPSELPGQRASESDFQTVVPSDDKELLKGDGNRDGLAGLTRLARLQGFNIHIKEEILFSAQIGVDSMTSDHRSESVDEMERVRQCVEEHYMAQLQMMLAQHEAEKARSRKEMQEEHQAHLQEMAASHQLEQDRMRRELEEDHSKVVQRLAAEHSAEKEKITQDVEARLAGLDAAVQKLEMADETKQVRGRQEQRSRTESRIQRIASQCLRNNDTLQQIIAEKEALVRKMEQEHSTQVQILISMHKAETESLKQEIEHFYNRSAKVIPHSKRTDSGPASSRQIQDQETRPNWLKLW